MIPFLKQVATLFYNEKRDSLSEYAFVFPNRRAGLFFQRHMAQLAGGPLFSPAIVTIDDLFTQLSGMQQVDRIGSLFMLYESYIKISNSDETFDSFLFWGEMILSDFDDIDKYRVNAEKLFRDLSDQKDIDDDYSYLNEEQIAAIRSFWSSFNPKNKEEGNTEKSFLDTWHLLFQLYTDFKQKLALKNLGYSGMIMRQVVERLESDDTIQIPFKHYVFVGLSALSETEISFLSFLKKNNQADFYWDINAPEVIDKNNRASHFINVNRMRFPSKYDLPLEPLSQPQIETIGVPSGIGQTKYVYTILKRLIDQGKLSNDKAIQKTAVVLPDEQLLMPVLNAIPEEIKRINVTMGYPLSNTPIASFFEYILALQRNARLRDGEPFFYFKDVLPLLKHHYIFECAPEPIKQLIEELTMQNRVYIPQSKLHLNNSLQKIFSLITEPKDFPDYLLTITEILNHNLEPQQDTDEEVPQRLDDIEREFIFHYFTTINRLKDLMSETQVKIKMDTFLQLMKRMTDLITIPFHGEPLSGLQVMGVLETRALDFDHLIILSVNEGIFPAKKAANSFIPYNLRRGFGLPTYEFQDSIWAYHFYRLIHRAKQVSLVYDTRSASGIKTGEMSRFIHQLRYHYEVPLKDKLIISKVTAPGNSPIVEEKNNHTLQILNRYTHENGKKLSASAINTYLDCPLKFYFSYIKGIREEDDINESVDNSDFGNIFHHTMELLYSDQKGKELSAPWFEQILKHPTFITNKITKAYADKFYKIERPRALEGRDYLIGEVIKKYVMKLLAFDQTLPQLNYLDSELLVDGTCTLTDKRKVYLKGFIDRLDQTKEATRIVDYKSGKGTLEFSNIEQLFDKTEKNRPKAIMQVFLYSMLYNASHPTKNLQPTIYYIQKIFDSHFTTAISQKKVGEIIQFEPYEKDFAQALNKCLNEIFDSSIPFSQTEDKMQCKYCIFKEICGR